MWKSYSIDSIKNNKASGISVIVGVFIATLFLSFLCSMFYNVWKDDIQRMIQEEGDWEGRITGEIYEETLTRIRQFANVDKAVINTALSGEKGTVVDIYFHKKAAIRQDLPAIVTALGMEEDAAAYHYKLLSMYLIRIPGDEAPRLMLPFYLMIVVGVCLSMILVIHTSFAVSMNSKVHQLGILSSIGATPRQILACLMQEAVTLTFLPVLLGLLSGIVLSLGAVCGMNFLTEHIVGGQTVTFRYHPAVFIGTAMMAVFTVLFSAWLPARRLSRLTPLEAIKGTGELQLTRKKQSRILATLFGVEGELAGNALKAQRKALRTTTLSLTLSFLGFMVLECFFTLSGISTKHTYFERYQDAWDIMVTVKNAGMDEISVGELQELSGVLSATVYQKMEAVCILSSEAVSQELLVLGGLEAVAGGSVSVGEKQFQVKAPIVIMDDDSFAEYCEQLGIVPRLDGGILVNRIWDSINSNFRYREYVPYVEENSTTSLLQSEENSAKTMEIPVLAYTQRLPALREEYDNYALVHFMPWSLWTELAGEPEGVEEDTYIRFLCAERSSAEALMALEKEAVRLLEKDFKIESENRIQERRANDEMLRVYKLVLGAFCALLAIIGIANVFSNTLGFLRQRRREFARYMSVGLTPGGLKKLLCIEALALVGRPVLVTVPLTIVLLGFMITASYLDPMEFIAVAPVVPILLFILSVFAFVALAYYLGAKRVLRCNLVETLRDDTLM